MTQKQHTYKAPQCTGQSTNQSLHSQQMCV